MTKASTLLTTEALGRAAALFALLLGCAVAESKGGVGSAVNAGSSSPLNVAPGWASVPGMDQPGTNGGGTAAVIEVSDAVDLAQAIDGETPAVVRIKGQVTGSFDVGSNKTIEGAPDAVLLGHLDLEGSTNVIVRNLKIVGFNCTDRAECSRGKDAVTMHGGAHHVWFDHCDISNGSDGNFDIGEGSDFVTISWTKFAYGGRRPGDHQFSNLIGSSDDAAGTDAGHLRITFDHCWWADNVAQRMPRVRFGLIHILNCLYTSAGNDYCIGLGADANVLVESCAFVGVKNPILAHKYSTEKSVLAARGNLCSQCTGLTEEKPGAVFAPPYPYVAEPAAQLASTVANGAGPQRTLVGLH